MRSCYRFPQPIDFKCGSSPYFDEASLIKEGIVPDWLVLLGVEKP